MPLNKPIKVLLLEDDADDFRLFQKELRGKQVRFEIDWAETLAQAKERLAKQSYHVVITDLSVSDSFGFQTVSELREHCEFAPIIVLTSLEDEDAEKEILSAGAQDYLVKGDRLDRNIVRVILHAAHRQQAANEVSRLVNELEQSQALLQEQARQLQEKNLRLEQLNRTAREFVDNVSHDFRTPLTVIKDYVMIMEEGMVGDVNEEQKKMLGKVAVRADDLNNMVDDLLDVGKLESGLFSAWRRRVSAQQTVMRAVSMLEQRAQVKNVTLDIDCDLAATEIFCDAEKASRVITNLAINAIKFTPEGGAVRLSAVRDDQNRQVVISVSDDGAGIDKESVKKIFQRFRQLDDQVRTTEKGFGLGLSIAQSLCKINLGELSVQSEIGVGSTFSFTIPLAEPVEVVRRWLASRADNSENMQVIKITTSHVESESKVNELSNFLNCLLRQDDIVFRTNDHQWLLVTVCRRDEQETWFERAAMEFERSNRNRPLNPLASYSAESMCSWNAEYSNEQIVSEFAAAAQTDTTCKEVVMI